MIIAELFIIANIFKRSICPSNDEKGKQYVVYPYNEILFSNKRKEVLMHSTAWMELKNITLNERSQAQKTIYCMISFR